MRIKELTLAANTFQSFNARRDYIPQHQNIWHYHQELELIYVINGSGRLFVGDCIHQFQTDEIILIGPNIPHYWLFDELSDHDIDCIVIHFNQNWLGEYFLNLPETYFLKELIQESNKVLSLKLTQSNSLKTNFFKILENNGISRLTILLETLFTFKKQYQNKLISNEYNFINHTEDVKRMNVVLEYIRENFSKTIPLDDLAKLAQMTKSSFSRYFKQKTGKTPMQIIFELRISSACKLLNNPNYTLKEICFETGFNNPVSFHKVFKSITKLTPTAYRKQIAVSNNKSYVK